MDPREAKKLRQEWQDKGSPHCDHPQTVNEVMGRFKTGDKICTTCGEMAYMGRFPQQDNLK